MDKITESDILNFPENLQNIMDINNLRASDVSRGTGLSTAYMSQILSGKRSLRLKTAIKIARFLKVSLDSLVGLPTKDKCFRCGGDADWTWNICADGNQERYVCTECDIALNETVLKFMGFDNWEKMMVKYRKKLLGD